MNVLVVLVDVGDASARDVQVDIPINVVVLGRQRGNDCGPHI